jgi:hypothetical protein
MLIGREVGKKVTFRELLTTQSGDLREGFKALSPEVRDVLVSKHQQEKEDKENMPKRVSNAAMLKAIYSQVEVVSDIVSVRITSLTCF